MKTFFNDFTGKKKIQFVHCISVPGYMFKLQRQENLVVHSLARWALFPDDLLVWKEEVPLDLESVFQADLSELLVYYTFLKL